MNLKTYEYVINKMFTDSMDIYTSVRSENKADGTISQSISVTPTQTEVPCKLSISKADSPQDINADGIPVTATHKIFCAKGIQLNAGDRVVVKKLAPDSTLLATYDGVIGLPNQFVTHTEVLLGVQRMA